MTVGQILGSVFSPTCTVSHTHSNSILRKKDNKRDFNIYLVDTGRGFHLETLRMGKYGELSISFSCTGNLILISYHHTPILQRSLCTV